MLDKKQQEKIAEQVSIEIATICNFYKVDFYSLRKSQRNMLVEIFQSGVKWQDWMKI